MLIRPAFAQHVGLKQADIIRLKDFCKTGEYV